MTPDRKRCSSAADEIELTVLPELARDCTACACAAASCCARQTTSLHEREPFFWGALRHGAMVQSHHAGARHSRRSGRRPAPEFPGRHRHPRPGVRRAVGAAPAMAHSRSSATATVGRGAIASRSTTRRGLTVTITQRLRNLSDEPMPGGIGSHPWFPTPVEVRINSALTFGSAKDHAGVDPQRVSGRSRSAQRAADGAKASTRPGPSRAIRRSSCGGPTACTPRCARRFRRSTSWPPTRPSAAQSRSSRRPTRRRDCADCSTVSRARSR